jgi:hypothetical protein
MVETFGNYIWIWSACTVICSLVMKIEFVLKSSRLEVKENSYLTSEIWRFWSANVGSFFLQEAISCHILSAVYRVNLAHPSFRPHACRNNDTKWRTIKADSHIPWRSHAGPLPRPCRFKGRFKHTMPFPCRDPAILWQCCVLRESFLSCAWSSLISFQELSFTKSLS